MVMVNSINDFFAYESFASYFKILLLYVLDSFLKEANLF